MIPTNTEYRPVAVNEDDRIVIKALLEAGDRFVSGSRLAEQIGISRTAIRDKLEKLRGSGFDFQAVRNRGYRIVRQPNVFHPALLGHALETLSTDTEVLYFDTIDSTNSEAERRLAYGREAPFAIVSGCQSKGYGRLGRKWHSASTDNLYLSVAFRPENPPPQLRHFTLWAGIRICSALQTFVPKTLLRIKWPNDLHCEGRKFAGMLTEAKSDADGLKTIVFGIGININSNPTDYPEEIRHLATSLYAVHGEELPLNDVAAHVIKAIRDAYEIGMVPSNTKSLKDAWEPLDSLRGKFVTARIGQTEISGLADGIDESGALLLRNESGRLQPVSAGDVTLH